MKNLFLMIGLVVGTTGFSQTFRAITVMNAEAKVQQGESLIVYFEVDGENSETYISLSITSQTGDQDEINVVKRIRDLEKVGIGYNFEWIVPDSVIAGSKTLKINYRPLNAGLYLLVEEKLITSIAGRMNTDVEYMIYDQQGRFVRKHVGSELPYDLPVGLYIYMSEKGRGKYLIQ